MHFGKLEDAENMAIFSQTYSLKYPNKAFLVRKLFFFVCTIFCISANFRVLIPNITTVFSNSYSKNTQNDIFGLKFKDFYFFTKLFKLSTQSYTNKAFFFPKLKLFVLHELPFHKSQDTDSNYRNFLKTLV